MRWRKYLNTKTFMAGCVIFLMTGGLLGFVLTGSPSSNLGQIDSSTTYNGFKLEATQTGIRAEIDENEYLFSTFPFDVDYIDVDRSVIDRLRDAKMVIITSDPESEDSLAIGGFSFDLSQALSASETFVEVGFTEENSFGRAVRTCDDSTAFVPVILVQAENNTRIEMQGNCLIVNATTTEDILRLKDRLAYGVLGVIE